MNSSTLSTASTEFEEDVSAARILSSGESLDEIDARSCELNEEACLEQILQSFFAIYAPERIDEAKQVAESTIDHLAALDEELNDKHIADLMQGDKGQHDRVGFHFILIVEVLVTITLRSSCICA